MTTPVKRRRVPVHGVLLLDKPAGMSSTQALAKAKWLLNAEKAGHTGTLDPFATGLLPLCLGEATKFAQDLLDADKTYEASIHLGVTTTTGDTEGDVLETRPVAITQAQAEAALAMFRGVIRQVPPMYSALKRDGKPLYAYAREGVTLEREAREVVIHDLTLLEFSSPVLKIRVCCSKGTYVRVLGEDIGKALGCGAHLTQLRRTRISDFDISAAHTLDELAVASDLKQALLPVDALLSSFQALVLDDEAAGRFLHGQRINLQKLNLFLPAGTLRLKVYSGSRLLGTAQLVDSAILSPERLIAFPSDISSPAG